MIIVELAIVALLFLLGVAGAVTGVVWMVTHNLFRSFPGLRNDANKSSAIAAQAGETVQAIMSEKNAQTRLALLLRSVGISSMPHRDGMLLTRGMTATPLSGLLDGLRIPGVLGSGNAVRWPSRGIWIPDDVWTDLCTSNQLRHPVEMLETVRNSARVMPYEGGTLADSLLTDSGTASLPKQLTSQLHLPVDLLSSKEKVSIEQALNNAGVKVTPGDFATSVTLADLLDKAASRHRSAIADQSKP